MTPVFSTALFGNINYLQELFQFKQVFIESKEHFKKQSFRNRFEILTSNGVQQLSIPVIRPKGSKTPIEEVTISHDTDWRKDHWKAIEGAYSSSPYFEHYGSEVRTLIYQNENKLLQYNENIAHKLHEWLGLSMLFQPTIAYLETAAKFDFRAISDKSKKMNKTFEPYIQVFNSPIFHPNLSILDALFCNGPLARKLILP